MASANSTSGFCLSVRGGARSSSIGRGRAFWVAGLPPPGSVVLGWCDGRGQPSRDRTVGTPSSARARSYVPDGEVLRAWDGGVVLAEGRVDGRQRTGGQRRGLRLPRLRGRGISAGSNSFRSADRDYSAYITQILHCSGDYKRTRSVPQANVFPTAGPPLDSRRAGRHAVMRRSRDRSVDTSFLPEAVDRKP